MLEMQYNESAHCRLYKQPSVSQPQGQTLLETVYGRFLISIFENENNETRPNFCFGY